MLLRTDHCGNYGSLLDSSLVWSSSDKDEDGMESKKPATHSLFLLLCIYYGKLHSEYSTTHAVPPPGCLWPVLLDLRPDCTSEGKTLHC